MWHIALVIGGWWCVCIPLWCRISNYNNHIRRTIFFVLAIVLGGAAVIFPFHSTDAGRQHAAEHFLNSNALAVDCPFWCHLKRALFSWWVDDGWWLAFVSIRNTYHSRVCFSFCLVVARRPWKSISDWELNFLYVRRVIIVHFIDNPQTHA